MKLKDPFFQRTQRTFKACGFVVLGLIAWFVCTSVIDMALTPLLRGLLPQATGLVSYSPVFSAMLAARFLYKNLQRYGQQWNPILQHQADRWVQEIPLTAHERLERLKSH